MNLHNMSASGTAYIYFVMQVIK